MNNLIFEDISLLAFKNIEDERIKEPFEKLAFLRLKELYEEYNKGIYSLEECKKIKEKIKQEYENYLKEFYISNIISKKYNKNMIYTEDMKFNINDTCDKDDILAFALIVIGAWTDDMDFVDKTFNRINNEKSQIL